MQIPLLDLKAQYQTIREEIRPILDEICDSQYFILGAKVVQFESQLAQYCHVNNACGVSSGSDALIIALMAEGIGHGDQVITTTYTFFATAGAIARVGATPVFVDIDPCTFNIDPSQIASKITPATKAIIPVHLYGQTAEMDAIMAIANKHNLIVIEDAAQAIGSEYKQKRAGSIAHYGCFSFFPSKNLGGFGDGGMVVTKHPEKIEKLQYLRNHGMNPKYYHTYVGGNFRLDAIQAAVLSVKLKYLDSWSEARQKNAQDYRQLFANSKCSNLITTPEVAPTTTRHIYNQFCIRIANGQRDTVWKGLQAAKIGCDVYYPVPMHQQTCFSHLGYKTGDFPHAETAATQTLALPIYPELTHEQRIHIVSTIEKILQETNA